MPCSFCGRETIHHDELIWEPVRAAAMLQDFPSAAYTQKLVMLSQYHGTPIVYLKEYRDENKYFIANCRVCEVFKAKAQPEPSLDGPEFCPVAPPVPDEPENPWRFVTQSVQAPATPTAERVHTGSTEDSRMTEATDESRESKEEELASSRGSTVTDVVLVSGSGESWIPLEGDATWKRSWSHCPRGAWILAPSSRT